MLILLPPSKGKAEPKAGDPVDLDSLAFAAELGERRAGLRGRADAGEPRRDRQLSASRGQPDGSSRSIRGSVATRMPESVSIVSRLDRSISLGDSGQGVRTTSLTVRPAERAASTVSSVWLIVPRPGDAAIATGRPRSTARSRTR